MITTNLRHDETTFLVTAPCCVVIVLVFYSLGAERAPLAATASIIVMCCLLWTFKTPHLLCSIQITILDRCMILLLIVEGLGVYVSIYPVVTRDSLTEMIFGVLVYFWLKVLTSKQALLRLSSWCCVAGLLIAIAWLFHTAEILRVVSEQDRSNPLVLKPLLGFPSWVTASSSQLGRYSPGEIGTLFLLIIPHAAILLTVGTAKIYKGIGIVTYVGLLIALLCTFSAGSYIAVLTYHLVFAYLKRRGGRVTRVSWQGACIAVSAIVCVCLSGLAGAVAYTGSLGTLEGQRRSLAGRINVWQNAMGIVYQHPVVGIGSGTYGHVATGNWDQPFTGRLFNTGLSIVVEKGAVGIAIYCLVGLCVLRASLREIREQRQKCDPWKLSAMAALAACVIRDLSYSSVFEHGMFPFFAIQLAMLESYGCL